METNDLLTLRQARFVDEYPFCGNGSEAARRAGYSEKTAKEIASQNLTKPAVAAAIEARQAEYRAVLQITKQDVIGGVLGAINMAREQNDPASMIQGAMALARMLGYIAPSAVRGAGGASAPGVDGASIRQALHTMSDEELPALAQPALFAG